MTGQVEVAVAGARQGAVDQVVLQLATDGKVRLDRTKNRLAPAHDSINVRHDGNSTMGTGGVSMVGWLGRKMSDAVAKLEAVVDQDADPAALIPSPRRTRRRSAPISHRADASAEAADGGPTTGAETGPDQAHAKKASRWSTSDLTESGAQDELARIMAEQQRRMRGRRRSDPNN